jgi:hypothetical protein
MANKHQALNVAIEITKQYARSAEDSKEPARILKEIYEMLLKLQDDVGKAEVI